ncbi:MAG: LacI family transcriptional regulator [Chloroflexi bacterium]|nr:LacI family transcriptional regulator [Chloroflexota bacterium]
MKRPTQADVARLAGVSRATVSYVLNQQENSRVPISQETRRRVLEAAQKLGYEPDARAQSLRSGLTRTLGLLIPDLQNPHFWQIIQGVTQQAREAGYELLLSSSELDREREEDSLKALARRRVDGLILLVAFTSLSEEKLEELAARRLPIVVIGCRDGVFDCIGSNYYDGARKVMAHLLSLGHRRIAFLHGVANITAGQDRLLAYERGLEEAGLPYDEGLVERCGPSIEDGYNAAMRLLNRTPRPTAIVAINDLLALGALRAASDMQLEVPKDISIVGYDDIFLANYLCQRLTTVHAQAEAIGQGAVKLLLRRLQNPELPPQSVELPTRLIIRESTGRAPRVAADPNSSAEV